MNSNDIRKMIAKVLKEENHSNEYINSIRSRLDENQAQAVFHFTIKYLHNSVDLMDQVYAAASAANCLTMFQPIFNASFNYWSNKYDYIPDHIGIAGICDDAYLSMKLMQQIANTHIPSTNQVLMPGVNSDIEQHNQYMAILLGPETVKLLNSVAIQTFQSAYIQDSLNNIVNAAMAGTLFGGGSLNMIHNMLEQNRMEERVNVQLGAMGIF